MESLAHRPNFFIVGAPKSGTTSLYEYLERHPDVLMSTIKEPHYFSTDFHRLRRLTLDQYLSLFLNPKQAKMVGEASATYIYSQKAPQLIKEFSPDARIIVILRNPVDMIYSLHAQRVWNGREDILDFAEALDAEEDRRKGLRLPPYPPPPQVLLYRDLGNYVPYVSSYLETFGGKGVLILIFEEFIANTPQIYTQVCEFLDIDPAYKPEFEIYNANKILKSMALRRLPTSPVAKTLRKVLPKPLRDKAKAKLVRVNTKLEKRVPMKADLRHQLEQDFAESITQLSELLDRDLFRIWKPRASQEIVVSPRPIAP